MLIVQELTVIDRSKRFLEMYGTVFADHQEALGEATIRHLLELLEGGRHDAA